MAKDLDSRVEEYEARAAAAKSLADIANRYPDVFAEFAALVLSAKKDQNGIPVVPAGRPQRVRRGEAKAPTASVLNWLRSHPKGGYGREIVAALEGEIVTESEDRKGVLFGTLSSLERRGKISSVKDEKGSKKYLATTPK